jgi:DNA-binding transcriptional ArsR family regulator
VEQPSAIFLALSDPTRLALLERLRREGSLSVSDLSEGLPVTRQAVTKHLDALADTGLVVIRRQGRERLHELQATRLKAVDDWLEPYAAEWRSRLTRLKRHVEEHP